MFYQKLKFPKVRNRPFFYTNFVQTVDGKVQVKSEGYWPIGSKKDYEVLVELRLYADCLIHGGNLAREFGEITSKNINKRLFRQQRRVLGKSSFLPYYVATKHRKGLEKVDAKIHSGSLTELAKNLFEAGYRNVLIEGGPTLLTSFLKEDLLDEIFLTIAPKIFGTKKDVTLNIVENYLFPKESIKKLKLLSIKNIDSELYLRYEVLK